MLDCFVMKTEKNCEVCGSVDLKPVLNLGMHPMCDDLIPVSSTSICEEFPIEILLCSICLTAHQKYQIPKVQLFPKNYHYRSRHTKDVVNGMHDLVENVSKIFPDGLKNKKILDIGSNDGTLLDIFASFGAITAGIETTDAALDSLDKSHLIYQNYFDINSSKKLLNDFGIPDVITFTNVFAHIEDLNSMISALNFLMGPQTLLVIENHYLGSVLDKMQFDTFYHEHPRTYSASSFAYVAKSLNAIVNSIQFPKRYGGNIRVFISKNQHPALDTSITEIISNEKNFDILFLNMNSKIEEWRRETTLRINELVKEYGALPAKAFPGRAAILVKLLNLNSDHISAVYEKNESKKIGHFLPGTRIPIKPDLDLMKINVNMPIINLAWHIDSEIKTYLNEIGYKGSIFNILEPSRY